MMVRRWVIPCVLGLCATAAAVQDDTDQSPLFPEKRVLLVLAGVLRQFETTWSKLEKDFVVPNERAGYRFTIVLHTSMHCSCGRAPEPITSAASDDERLEMLQRIVGPRDITYVDSLGLCKRNNDSYTHTYFRDDRWVHCGALHFAFRSVQALNHMGDLKSFSKILVIRPDVVLQSPLVLDAVCLTHPGVNVVTGDCNERCNGLHWNDIDMSWLLCDGRHGDVFKEALASFGRPCQGTDCQRGLVHLPRDFHPMKFIQKNHSIIPDQWRCDYEVQLCRTVQLLAQHRLRFGTLESLDIRVKKNQDFKEGKCKCR